MTMHDPQPQDLFGHDLDKVEAVLIDHWFEIEEAHIERGNLHLTERESGGEFAFPLKEVRGIRK
ncbi:hypothetical protein SEA_SHAGRAT_97 [Rhodococcus phage Shagrat]|nr:hypothetical protein SEA_SHAGRAT_97 [Rhodococcus phage Shagrat]